MTTADMITSDKNFSITGNSEEVSSLLHVAREGKNTQAVMIMDADALVTKCLSSMNSTGEREKSRDGAPQKVKEEVG